MHTHVRSFAVAALSICIGAAHAAVTEIRWTNDLFEYSSAIAPGKIAEVCGRIHPRSAVDWRFSADGALAFNIHRHAGDEVVYATRSFDTRAQNGVFNPKREHEWCWMWTNETSAPVNVRIRLQQPQ
jgi:hypothetical protein